MVQQDSAEAFTELYERHWKNCFAQAYKRLRSTTAAEEIVQEAFLALWERRAAIQPDNLPAYLGAIVKYAVFHQMAKEEQRPGAKKMAGDEMTAFAAGADASRLEEQVEARCLARLVDLSARELPEKCRLVFKYNKQLGYTMPEVASTLDISLKTAEAHLTKALKYIRLKLGNNFFFF